MSIIVDRLSDYIGSGRLPATIGSQAWRIRDMIGDCMLFARPPSPELQNHELCVLVRQAAVDALGALKTSPNCLEFDLPATPVTTEIDVSQIQTLVGHLVRLDSIGRCIQCGVAPE